MVPDFPTSNTISEATTPVNRRDLWQVAWRIARSDELLVCVLLGLAGLLLLGAWLPQVPSGMPPGGDSRWQALVQHRFGAVTAPLQTLGLFSISDTLLFRALIGLIGCALAVRLVDYVECAWNGRFPPPSPEGTVVLTTLEQSPGDAVASWHRALRRHRLRVRYENDALMAGEDYFCLDRFPLADAARILAVLGGLVLIIGVALTSSRGWRSQDILAGVGEAVVIGPHTPYMLRLDALQKSASGQVSLVREAEAVATGFVAPGWAMYAAGLSVHFHATGPAVRASAVLSDGQSLELLASTSALPVSELLLHFTPDESEQVFATQDTKLLVRVSFSQPSQLFHVLLYQRESDKSLFEGELPFDGHLQAEDITFKLSPERYARLSVTRDPGLWPTAAGGLFGLLGLLGVLVWPPRRTWLCANEAGQTEIRGDTLPVDLIEPAEEKQPWSAR